MYFGISIEPLISYLKLHPQAGFIAAFLIAFLESLPIIGQVIPGSVTMTAMGTMVGSSVLPAYSTFGWAIIGALSGDTISYILGFRYHRELRNIWPLKRYPKLFTFGEQFFKKHGGKSLLIGRFVGPMRSAIPMVAGVMRMKQARFFLGAIPSAVLWAFAYLLPGILIGAISQELPKGKAGEFILGFILAIVAFWLIIWFLKFFIAFILRSINKAMHRTWMKMKKIPLTNKFIKLIQQHEKPNEHRPLNYLALAFISFVLLFLMLYNTLHHGRLSHWNSPIFYLLQSIHTHTLTTISIWITLLAAKPVLLVMTIALSIWLYTQGYKRTMFYWLALVFFTAAGIGFFKILFYNPRPGGLNYFITSSSFPSGHTTLAMSLFGFLTYLFTHRIRSRSWHVAQYSIALTMILLVAASRLYLGAHWFLDIAGSMSLGAAILFLAVILYRRYPCEKIPPRKLTLVVSLCLFIPWLCYGIYISPKMRSQMQPIWPSPVINTKAWWQHPTNKLPIYRLSRLGHPAQPFNLQWAGDLKQISEHITALKWQRYHHEEKLKSMIERLITLKPSKHMPLLPPLFHNRPPAAVFVKTLADKDVILELRLWQSDATLKQDNTPIWLGNISYHSAGRKIIALKAKDRSHYQILNALKYLEPKDKMQNWKIITSSTDNLPHAIKLLAWDGKILIRHNKSIEIVNKKNKK